MKKWIEEFGEEWAVPAQIEALVAAGHLVDVSWHNDSCPSFWLKASGPEGVDEVIYIYVEHPTEPELFTHRFVVAYFNTGEYAEETDSIDVLLDYLSDHWDIVLPKEG